MSRTFFVEILGEKIDLIEEQIQFKKCPLTERLKQLRELVLQKLSGSDVKEEDITPKLSLKLEKKSQLESKLETLRDDAKKELRFKIEMIEKNNDLIAERKEQYERILNAERATYEQQIALANNAFQMREEGEFKSRIERMKKQLDVCRIMNTAVERSKKREWTQQKDLLQEVLNGYNAKMKEQQDKMQQLHELYEYENCELQRYKILCDEQDEDYHRLMQEKEDYLEGVRQQKLYEIQKRMAERRIVKFIEQYYPIWKKRKLKAAKKKSKYKSRYGR